ncbi:MAG: response regulator transcription factor [Planctomycetaceae bacterium]
MKILIVEDEEAIARGLKFNFEQEGYETVLADDGPAALECFEEGDRPFDLVVLDLMLPGISGYDVCRAIREKDAHLPILVLSARTLPEDKVQAFELGTDQYMTKPFALPELLARVRNLVARRPVGGAPAPNGAKSARQYRFGRVLVNFDTFEVHVGETVHALTTLEMKLLTYFVENAGSVLARSQILRDVWEEQADITTRAIDNFVLRLRRIIEEDPAEPRHILSVRGTGYRFVGEPD